MTELIRMLETIWISAAFAEAGDPETAQEFMDPNLCETECADICLTK